MGFRFSGGGCCCADCRIVYDLQSSRTSADFVGFYTQEAGTWTLNGDEEYETSSSNAVLLTVAEAEAARGVYLQCHGFSAAVGDKLRFYVQHASANDNLYVEVTLGDAGTDGTLKAFRVNGGSASQIDSTVTLADMTSGEMTLDVCAANGYLVASLRWFTSTFGGSTPQTSTLFGAGAETGLRVAIGTGTMAGTATFGNVIWEYHKDETHEDCPYCTLPCSSCIGNVGPAFVKVEVTGLGNDACNCNFNGSYIIPFECGGTLTLLDASGDFTSPCGDPCGGFGNFHQQLNIQVQFASSQLQVIFSFIQGPASCNSYNARYELDITEPYDCLGMDDVIVPYDSYFANVGCTPLFGAADFEDAIVKVTAL